MDKIFVLSFTARGYELALKIKDKLKSVGESDITAERVGGISGLHEYVKPIFMQGGLIIFVGAAGIAVRAAAPFIKSKLTDPAVIVIDELGRFVIPVLSGHIGGANRYAVMLAGLLSATPVITTATDINGVFSVDSYAHDNGYAIMNPEAVKAVSGALLDGQEVGLYTELEIVGALPRGLRLTAYGRVGIVIGLSDEKKMFDTTLYLIPRMYHVGVGVRRGADCGAFEGALLKVLTDKHIPIEAVAAISSIDLKKNEEAIVSFCEKHRIRFVTYTTEELGEFADRFAQSKFVKETTGVGNVCETAAYMSSGNAEIIMPKTVWSDSGITITAAIAKETWRVSFEADNDRTGL